MAKWTESPGVERHEALLPFTLKSSTKSLSITGEGEGPQRSFRGCPHLLPPFPFSRPVCRGCLSPPVPLFRVSHSASAASSFEATQGKESERAGERAGQRARELERDSWGRQRSVDTRGGRDEESRR